MPQESLEERVKRLSGQPDEAETLEQRVSRLSDGVPEPVTLKQVPAGTPLDAETRRRIMILAGGDDDRAGGIANELGYGADQMKTPLPAPAPASDPIPTAPAPSPVQAPAPPAAPPAPARPTPAPRLGLSAVSPGLGGGPRMTPEQAVTHEQAWSQPLLPVESAFDKLMENPVARGAYAQYIARHRMDPEVAEGLRKASMRGIETLTTPQSLGFLAGAALMPEAFMAGLFGFMLQMGFSGYMVKGAWHEYQRARELEKAGGPRSEVIAGKGLAAMDALFAALPWLRRPGGPPPGRQIRDIETVLRHPNLDVETARRVRTMADTLELPAESKQYIIALANRKISELEGPAGPLVAPVRPLPARAPAAGPPESVRSQLGKPRQATLGEPSQARPSEATGAFLPPPPPIEPPPVGTLARPTLEQPMPGLPPAEAAPSATKSELQTMIERVSDLEKMLQRYAKERGKVLKPRKPPKYDPNVNIFNAIRAAGGVNLDKLKKAGTYTEWKEAGVTRIPGVVTKKGRHGPDTVVDELSNFGYPVRSERELLDYFRGGRGKERLQGEAFAPSERDELLGWMEALRAENARLRGEVKKVEPEPAPPRAPVREEPPSDLPPFDSLPKKREPGEEGFARFFDFPKSERERLDLLLSRIASAAGARGPKSAEAERATGAYKRAVGEQKVEKPAEVVSLESVRQQKDRELLSELIRAHDRAMEKGDLETASVLRREIGKISQELVPPSPKKPAEAETKRGRFETYEEAARERSYGDPYLDPDELIAAYRRAKEKGDDITAATLKRQYEKDFGAKFPEPSKPTGEEGFARLTDEKPWKDKPMFDWQWERVTLVAQEWGFSRKDMERIAGKPLTDLKASDAAPLVGKMQAEGLRRKLGIPPEESVVAETPPKKPATMEDIFGLEEKAKPQKPMTVEEFALRAKAAQSEQRRKALEEAQQRVLKGKEGAVSKREQLGISKPKEAQVTGPLFEGKPAEPTAAPKKKGEPPKKQKSLFGDDAGFIRLFDRDYPPGKDPRNRAIMERIKLIRRNLDRPPNPNPPPGEASVPGGGMSALGQILSADHALERNPATFPIVKALKYEGAAERKRWEVSYGDKLKAIAKDNGIKPGSPENEMVAHLLDRQVTSLTPARLRLDPSYRGDKEAAIRAYERFRREIYDPIIGQIRDPKLQQSIGKVGYISGYFPHIHRLEFGFWKDKSVAMEAMRALLPEQFLPGVFRPRGEGVRATKAGAIEATQAYINMAGRTIFDIPAYKKARPIIDKLPEGPWREYADYYARNYMNDPGAKSALERNEPFMNVSRFIADRFYDGLIGFRLKTYLVNLTQVGNTYVEIGGKWSRKGAQMLLTKEGRRMFHESGLVNDLPMLEGMRPASKFREFGVHGGMKVTEYVNRGVPYLGAYAKGKAQGMSDKMARQYAYGVVGKTQFFYGRESPIRFTQQFGPLGRQFTSFPLKESEFIGNIIADAARKRDRDSLARLGRLLVITVGPPVTAAVAGVEHRKIGDFYLTLKDLLPGAPPAPKAVIQDFRQWVIAMEDGKKSVWDIPPDLVTWMARNWAPGGGQAAELLKQKKQPKTPPRPKMPKKAS